MKMNCLFDLQEKKESHVLRGFFYFPVFVKFPIYKIHSRIWILFPFIKYIPNFGNFLNLGNFPNKKKVIPIWENLSYVQINGYIAMLTTKTIPSMQTYEKALRKQNDRANNALKSLQNFPTLRQLASRKAAITRKVNSGKVPLSFAASEISSISSLQERVRNLILISRLKNSRYVFDSYKGISFYIKKGIGARERYAEKIRQIEKELKKPEPPKSTWKFFNRYVSGEKLYREYKIFRAYANTAAYDSYMPIENLLSYLMSNVYTGVDLDRKCTFKIQINNRYKFTLIMTKEDFEVNELEVFESACKEFISSQLNKYTSEQIEKYKYDLQIDKIIDMLDLFFAGSDEVLGESMILNMLLSNMKNNIIDMYPKAIGTLNDIEEFFEKEDSLVFDVIINVAVS